ncbi:hypothetical protein D9757_005389 [Collybiopsis confluens]|uniref:Uncharacterized protein n=1 Tax=Collybiopsis confluens TaxID=2823264 RepID=A0A8H5HL65_9AGAR|nr:hypothetical protein D9757_005389 [Collybiopsis confluens]
MNDSSTSEAPQKSIKQSRSKHKHKRPDTSLSEIHDAPTRFYYSDRKPDSLNLEYGRLSRGEVPRYSVFNRGKKILGLPAAYTAFKTTDKGIEVGIYGNSQSIFSDRSKLRKRLSATPRRTLTADITSSKYQETNGFLPLPSHGGRKPRNPMISSDSESDSVISDSSSSGDERDSYSTAHQKTLKRLEQLVSADPSSIPSWLALLSQTLSTVNIHSKNSEKARSEIALAIISRALSAHPANSNSPLLRIKYLLAGEKIWEDRDCDLEWEKALNSGDIDLWMEWLEWRMRKAKSSDALNDVIDAALRVLSSRGNSEQSEIEKVRVFWRTAIALQQAGYHERATALFQAQAELTFEIPQALSRLSLDTRLEGLEEFWESEVPRMGERESKGWANWASHKYEFALNVLSATTSQSTELDPYRQWAEYETSVDRVRHVPARSTNEYTDRDPYSVILFADIRSLLFDLQTRSAKQVFRLAWLSALGLHLPGFASSLSENGRDDRWSYSHLTKPTFLDAVFPCTHKFTLIADAVAGTLVGKQKVYEEGFGPMKNWSWGSLHFFEPLFGSTGLWNKSDVAQVDIDFVMQVFSSLRLGTGDIEWDLLALTFEVAISAKSALKLSRSFLSTARDSLLHWAAHAQMERMRGKLDEARKVYQTILIPSGEVVPRTAESRLWWDWAEMEWLGGESNSALSVILRAARVEGRGGVAILRTKRSLQDFSRDSDFWQDREAWIKLAALLDILTSNDVQDMMITLEEQLAKMTPNTPAHESLTMSALLLLYRYGSSLKNPMPPSILRERVIRATEEYPHNSIVLGMFLEVERGQGVWGRVRATLGDTRENGKDVARRVQEIWIARWESGRWESEIERTRTGLNGAVAHERTSDSYLIWRMYIEFEIRVKRYDKAKDLLWRALGRFPLCKGSIYLETLGDLTDLRPELYLLAFGPLRSVFQNNELNTLAETMIERGIRMRRGLDEVLQDWGPRRMDEEDVDDKDDDEIEYNANELRRLHREEWPDADFDLPEGQPLHAMTDKDDEDEEDWDVEMDLGKSGGARTIEQSQTANVAEISQHQMVTIRPAQNQQGTDNNDDEEEDEGVSTIKVAALPKPISSLTKAPIDEDFEEGFALPSDLTRLSLAPLSLNHRSSKNSLEWGDKDHTSSSQSSDAYSTLGFANASSSSNSTSSASLPESETDEDEDEDAMDGLVIPSGLFEANNAGSKLTHILEIRQKALFSDSVKVTSPDPEDDFEMGLVIDDDVDFSPSRLLYSAQHLRHANRSQSMPNARPKHLRLTSTRVKSIDRAKSPTNPPVSSSRQFQKLRLSPSPPLHPPSRSHTYQTLSVAPSPSPSSPSFLAPKPGSLRGQKSHSGLKPPTPPASNRKLTRQASLSSLLESSSSQVSGSGSSAAGPSKARYEEPTVASRAKTQKSTSRLRGLDYSVPPTRPSTPSTNPNAVRLTLPTVTRVKSRPALSSVFNNGVPPSPVAQSPSVRTASPLPPRPPSNLSNRASSRLSHIQPAAPKVMKRPKRQRTYGDGTELDGFEDLPTDRDKETRFRVQPKGYGNRIPGGTFSMRSSSDKSNDKNTIRRKRREPSGGSESTALAATVSSLRRSSKLDLPLLSKPLSPKKKKANSPNLPRKKPTLIRNLGGAGAPKVVGDMHWNPQTLRWEGNEQVLRDFDSVVTSTRPALITHLTGSSIGSPVGSFATGARKVGNMIFDPQRMCWISTLPPEEEEPDVFANLADDEDEDDGRGDTIRVNLQSALITPDTSVHSRTSTSMSDASLSRTGYGRSPSESGSERGSRASMVVDMDESFIRKCKDAEARHVNEMKGWKEILLKHDLLQETERSNLYEIRDLATRSSGAIDSDSCMTSSSSDIARIHAGGGRITLSCHGGKIWFSELSATYPLKLLSPNVTSDGVGVVYALTYGGGLVGGDSGSTKVFKARKGQRLASVQKSLDQSTLTSEITFQKTDFAIASEGVLLLLPDPVTCFRSASYSQIQTFRMANDASLIVLDWVTSGRKSVGEDWVLSRYYSTNEIIVEGKRIAKDVMLLEDDKGSPLADKLSPYSCYATLFLRGRMVEGIINGLAGVYKSISVMQHRVPEDFLWSLSPIDADQAQHGIVIRAAGKETENVKRWLKDALGPVEQLIGADVYRRTAKLPNHLFTLDPMSDEKMSVSEQNVVTATDGIKERKVMRRVDLRILPWLALLYFLNFLDRGNIGNARLYGMTTDIHVSDSQYLVALTAYFFPYALLEWDDVPVGYSNGLPWPGSQLRWTPVRVLLGVMEAGMYPGIVFYISRRSEMGTKIAYFFSSATISGAFSGLLAVAIHNLDGVAHLASWRWIFILEGLLTVVVACASYWMIQDYPETAKFLSEDESESADGPTIKWHSEEITTGAFVISRLQDDVRLSAAGEEYKKKYVWQSLKDWKTWAATRAHAVGIYMGFDGPLGCVATIAVGILGDRLSSRYYLSLSYVTVQILKSLTQSAHLQLGAVGYIILIASRSPALSYFAVFLGASAWVAGNVEGAYKRGVTLGMAIGFGNINGAVTSNIYRAKDSPWYTMGHAIVLAYIVIGLISTSLMRIGLQRENARRDRGERDEIIDGLDNKRADAKNGHYPSVEAARLDKGDNWSGFRNVMFNQLRLVQMIGYPTIV